MTVHLAATDLADGNAIKVLEGQLVSAKVPPPSTDTPMRVLRSRCLLLCYIQGMPAGKLSIEIAVVSVLAFRSGGGAGHRSMPLRDGTQAFLLDDAQPSSRSNSLSKQHSAPPLLGPGRVLDDNPAAMMQMTYLLRSIADEFSITWFLNESGKTLASDVLEGNIS